MKTFKRLGLAMYRKGQGWQVEGRNFPTFEGTGNKGTVMAQALEQAEKNGLVELVKGSGWRYVQANNA